MAWVRLTKEEAERLINSAPYRFSPSSDNRRIIIAPSYREVRQYGVILEKRDEGWFAMSMRELLDEHPTHS